MYYPELPQATKLAPYLVEVYTLFPVYIFNNCSFSCGFNTSKKIPGKEYYTL